MEEIMEPLQGIFNEVKEKLSGLKEDRSVVEAVMGFVHAVDWTEPWIIGLLCTHLILLLTVVRFQKHTRFQAVLFSAMVLVIFQSEKLNDFLGANWESFARQPYFDSSGFFISTMLSIPWLFILLIMLALYILEAFTLMVTLKKQHIVQSIKHQRAQEGNESMEDKKND